MTAVASPSCPGRLSEVLAPPLVAGFEATTLGAWPGRRAASVLLGGCNMRCPYCDRPEMLGSRRSGLALDQVVRRIRESAMDLGGLTVSGGEPTAHPALADVLVELRCLGLPIMIETNGSMPEVVERLIEDRLVDFVALDVKTTPERYDSATRSLGSWERVRRSISLVIRSGIDHEFRTTCYPSAVHTSDLPGIARELVGGRRYALQQFRPQRTLDPAASGVRPHDPDALRRAALCCAVHLPTVVRGV